MARTKHDADRKDVVIQVRLTPPQKAAVDQLQRDLGALTTSEAIRTVIDRATKAK